jgi:hypothetical protein
VLLDANWDASVDISDAVWVLGFLFSGLGPPGTGHRLSAGRWLPRQRREV